MFMTMKTSEDKQNDLLQAQNSNETFQTSPFMILQPKLHE
jgi:hypothetical protein